MAITCPALGSADDTCVALGSGLCPVVACASCRQRMLRAPLANLEEMAWSRCRSWNWLIVDLDSIGGAQMGLFCGRSWCPFHLCLAMIDERHGRKREWGERTSSRD